MSGRPVMVGLGEVLWDCLPSGRMLGGAPTNFAYMASVLGNEGVIASRVGDDDLGRAALEAMQALGIETSYVQRDPQHQTGTAEVRVDASGQPTFEIKYRVAWDYLEWTPAWQELAARSGVVCFGSLARRSSVSAATIQSFLNSVNERAVRICDVNLRDPFFSAEGLRWSFENADILKVNNDEIQRISALMGFGTAEEEAISRRLMEQFGLRLVCVTRGAGGSLLVSRSNVVEHPGIRVKVADAVGAGDAFTACLAHCYLRGCSLEEMSERANRFGAWVATQLGATPLVDRDRIEAIMGGSGDADPTD